MEFLTVINDNLEEKILIPKPRRLNVIKNHHKKKVIKNNKTKIHQKSINLEDISLDEINKDFKALNELIDEEICYNELNNILSSSSEDSFSNNKIQKSPKVKRPKRNVHF